MKDNRKDFTPQGKKYIQKRGSVNEGNEVGKRGNSTCRAEVTGKKRRLKKSMGAG